MKQLLQGKIFGMPRWVFFILLAFGLAVGLYLRSRSAGDAEEPEAEDYTGGEVEDGALEGIDEPGLAGAVGVASPPGGVYPVTTPIIPEGLTDVFGVLGGVIEGQGATIAELGAIRFPDAVTQPAEGPPVAAPGGGGGGAPKRPPQSVRTKPSKTEARRRVQAIAKKHGSRSPQAARARKRLGIKPPPPRKKKRR